MAKNKISISFSKSKQDIYEYLKTKDNISNYICNLVDKEMHSSNTGDDLESRIENILHKILSKKQIILPSTNFITSTCEDEEVISLINELF